MAAQKSYESNGVSLSKKTFYCGDRVKVSYKGLLAQSGAQQVFLHIGYGDAWEDKLLIPMEYDKGIFSAEIAILDFEGFEVCFKDVAENWDNNSGENYVFSISRKPARKEKAIGIKATKSSKTKNM